MRPSTTMPIRRRRRTAVLAALATGAAGLMLPLGGVAQATTGAKNYNCGKAYGAISRTDWNASFDVAPPAAVYVNESVSLALANSSVNVHSNEGSLWPGTYGGPFAVPMSFGGTAVTFTGSASGGFKAGGVNVPFNGTASWTAPAAAGDVAITMQNFSWTTNRNTSYTYQCAGTSTPKPYAVNTIVVKSRSHVTSTLAASTGVQRGDTLNATATVSVDGGSVAGNVLVSVAGGTALPYALVNGTVTFPVPTDLAPGTYPVKTQFVPADNTHYDGSSRTTDLVVREAVATTSSVQMNPPAFVDEPTTGTATVTAALDNPVGKPVGSFDISVDGTVIDNVTVDTATGKAPFSIPAGLAVGSHSIQAVFKPGNAHRFATSTATTAVAVNPPAARTTTTLTLDAAEIQTTVRGLAHISVSATAGTPTGAVTLSVNGQQFTQQLEGGEASVELPTLTPGEYPVQVSYTSNSPLNFRNSQATSATLLVLPPAAQTTTTVSLARGRIAPDDNNTVHVQVQGGTDGAKPAGRVNVQVDGTEYVVSLDADGKAVVELPNQLLPGTYPVRATYVPSNQNRFLASSSNLTSFVVAVPVVTTTAVALDQQQITEGGSVTASATVTTETGIPAGTVQFVVDGADHGPAMALSESGTVVVRLDTLGAGAHTVSARYVPAEGTDHLASSANPVGVQVNEAPIQAAVSVGVLAPVPSNQKIPVQATVSYSRGTPAGSITFTAGGQSVTAVVGANGVATAELPTLGIGEYEVVATFTSTDTTITATGIRSLTVTGDWETPVEPATRTVTTLTLSSRSTQYGQKVTATAAVSNSGVGVVEFNVGGTVLAAPVEQGRATVTLPTQTVGTRQVVATFVPSSSVFVTSRSTIALTVSKARTRATVTFARAAGRKTAATAVVTPAYAQQMRGKVTMTFTPSAAVKKKFKTKAKVQKVTVAIGGRGRAVARVKLLKGTWKVAVSYAGSSTASGAAVVSKVKVK